MCGLKKINLLSFGLGVQPRPLAVVVAHGNTLQHTATHSDSWQHSKDHLLLSVRGVRL